MISVDHFYITNWDTYIVPPAIIAVTRFRKNGSIDRRYRNAEYKAWVSTLK